MGRRIHLAGAHLRRWVQAGTAALTNGYYAGFFQGKIYTGGSKAICVPGLNCYSCPGALGACPLGSLQAVLGSRDYRFAFYVVGFLMLAGVVLGRFVCGWLCPFGLIQEALHKIPVGRKLRRLPGERWLKCLKYVLLAVFVILLPLYAVDAFGQGTPAFCKFICPAGTLEAGHPLLLMNTGLRAAVGWLFVWKKPDSACRDTIFGFCVSSVLPVSLSAWRNLRLLSPRRLSPVRSGWKKMHRMRGLPDGVQVRYRGISDAEQPRVHSLRGLPASLPRRGAFLQVWQKHRQAGGKRKRKRTGGLHDGVIRHRQSGQE